MRFIDQYKKGTENAGTYVLTICIFLLTYIFSILGVQAAMSELLSFNGALEGDNNRNWIFLFQLIPFLCLFISLLFCVKYLHKRPILSLFTARDRFDWKRFLTGFLSWGALITILFFSASWNNLEWKFSSSTFFPLLLISILLLPIQTAIEDVFFRGYLFQGLGKLFKHAGVSLLFTGLFFGGMHAGNPEIEILGSAILIFYIGSGLFLGIIAHMDDGLELGMGYHLVNNLFGVLIIGNDWSALKTDALWIDSSPPELWFTVGSFMAGQLLLIYFFSWRYKWSNWKKKLFVKEL